MILSKKKRGLEGYFFFWYWRMETIGRDFVAVGGRV